LPKWRIYNRGGLADWERKLRVAGEGPPEIRLLTNTHIDPAPRGRDNHSDAIAFVSATDKGDNVDWVSEVNAAAFGGPTTIFDAAPAVYWRTFSHAVHGLPPRYPRAHVRFLLSYAELANMAAAARAQRITVARARWILDRFRAHLANPVPARWKKRRTRERKKTK
jgi:hypothetical protein